MRLTLTSKILLVVVLAAVGGFALWKWPGRTSGDGSLLGRPLKVGVVTWPGYAGGLVANNGFKPNKESIFWTKHHQTVEFLLMEDTDIRKNAFAKGGPSGVDIVWSTVDFWANELPGLINDGVKARAVMQVDWSQGGDAIVADERIQRIEDLYGKKISLALFTPSHWLLEYNLQHSSLTPTQHEEIVKSLVGKNASPDARADFVAGRVDAAVCWEPDVTEALQKRKGAHILVSSRNASHLIADLMVAREDFIQAHPDVIKAFVAGWLDGTVEANRNPDQVVKLLMENEPLYKDLGPDVTRQGLPTVKWADLIENTQMFGLDGKTPPMFDNLFQEAGTAWAQRGYIGGTVVPAIAKDDRFLKELYAANPATPPAPSLPVQGPPSRAECERPTGPGTERISVQFATGSYTLDPDAKHVLDGVSQPRTFASNTYFCVEGNTDNVGDRRANIVLSEERAQAAVDYLAEHYHRDPGWFTHFGNGPDKPIASNSTPEGKAKNRRTDIMIVAR